MLNCKTQEFLFCFVSGELRLITPVVPEELALCRSGPRAQGQICSYRTYLASRHKNFCCEGHPLNLNKFPVLRVLFGTKHTNLYKKVKITQLLPLWASSHAPSTALLLSHLTAPLSQLARCIRQPPSPTRDRGHPGPIFSSFKSHSD